MKSSSWKPSINCTSDSFSCARKGESTVSGEQGVFIRSAPLKAVRQAEQLSIRVVPPRPASAATSSARDELEYTDRCTDAHRRTAAKGARSEHRARINDLYQSKRVHCGHWRWHTAQWAAHVPALRRQQPHRLALQREQLERNTHHHQPRLRAPARINTCSSSLCTTRPTIGNRAPSTCSTYACSTETRLCHSLTSGRDTFSLLTSIIIVCICVSYRINKIF